MSLSTAEPNKVFPSVESNPSLLFFLSTSNLCCCTLASGKKSKRKKLISLSAVLGTTVVALCVHVV